MQKISVLNYKHIFLIIGACFLYHKDAPAETLFSENFEDGEMILKCSGNCPEVTDEVTYNGQYSLKFELDYYDSYNNYRCEIQEDFANFNDVFWYSFNVYLPSTHETDSIWEVVSQWHGVPDFDIGEDWRNPPLSLHTTHGIWTIKNKWDSKENTFESGELVYDGEENWELGDYEAGVWVNWVFRIKWSSGDDGLLKVWKDGNLVINKNGPNTFNDEVAPYYKAGLYKGWQGSPELSETNVTHRFVYLDDFKIKVE